MLYESSDITDAHARYVRRLAASYPNTNFAAEHAARQRAARRADERLAFRLLAEFDREDAQRARRRRAA